MLKKGNADTKELILDAARSEFAAKGYYATSMDSIVKATGLSKGAIYWHFGSKFELFRAVLDRQVRNTKSIIFPSETDLEEQGLKEFFRKRGEQLIDYLFSERENTLLWLHINLEAQRGKTDIADLARRMLDSLVEDLMRRILDLEPDYGKDEVNLKELILLFRAILNGVMLDFQLRQTPDLAKKFWKFLIHVLIPDVGQENKTAGCTTCPTVRRQLN